MTLVPQKPKLHTIHHRKRVGAHHKHNKHYTKPYWPYLPLLLIVGMGLFVSSVWSGAARGVLGATSNITAGNLLTDTNAERQSFQRQDLQLSSQLIQAAQAKANDMASRDYWAHVTPDGKQPWTFIANTGYRYAVAGENLAYGFSSADATVQGWMNSPEHRANVLNADYSQVGFGVVTTPEYQGRGKQTIVVALYAKPASTATLASASLSDTTQTFPSASVPSQEIARVQVLSSSQPWALLFVVAIAAFGAGMFVLRHAIFWHRVLAKSEAFVVKHRMLDVIFVSIAVLGIILTRTAGFIQ